MSYREKDEFYYDSLEIIENFLALMARKENEIKQLYQQLEYYENIIRKTLWDPLVENNLQAGAKPDADWCPTIVAATVPALRNRLTRILTKDGGCKVIAEAENCTDLLSMFLEHRPKLVIADLELPTADKGYEVLKQIKSIYPNVVIMIVSRDLSEDILLKVMDIGAYDIISIPLNHFRLVANVKKIRSYLNTA